jgi:hypothetical protein
MIIMARCGCGHITEVKDLLRETKCGACKWLLVYASERNSFTLANHASFTVNPAKKKAART